MDLLANFSVKLDQAQIEQVITKAVEQQTGRKVRSINWNIQGYEPGDRPFDTGTPASASITVDLGGENVKSRRISSQWDGH